MNRLSIVVLVLVAAASTGCASTGAFTAANLTEVQLADDNYQIVATNVRGQSSAGYLLGVSAAVYTQLSTIAVARV